jgi:hypothetical protein
MALPLVLLAWLWIVGTAPLSAQAGGASPVAAPRPVAKPDMSALLVRGTEPIKGLPGFGANAFDAIYGEYRFETGATTVLVWATREALYFDPLAWTPRKVGLYTAQSRKGDLGNEGPAVREDGKMTEERLLIATELSVSDWTVIAAFPLEGFLAAEIDRFLGLFLDRFTYFLTGAKIPTDVSFPATIQN